jgi:GTP-binding protein EngB required for normal cell division
MDRAGALNAALDVGAAWLDPVAVDEARVTIDRALARLELGGDHTVVALVGATGSGKSSLFNALARMDIAEVGARRPMTSMPMACVWGEGGSSELLDWLEVPHPRRVTRETILDADTQAPLHGLVLLDLPDHDSTEVIHRVEVDRLVNQVDLLVWVVDPQKYGDDALHSGYLQRMVGHDGVMVLVLNQIDRLEPDEAETCRRDLRRLLDGDGLDKVPVLPVSATRGDGVDDLRELLAAVVQNRSAIEERLEADLQVSVASVASGLAADEPGEGEPVDVDRMLEEMAAAAGVPAVLDAVTAEYRRRGWIRVGWPLLRWLRKLTPDALGRLHHRVAEDDLRVIATSLVPVSAPSQRPRVELAVETLVAANADPLPRRWSDAMRAAVAAQSAGGPDLVGALDSAVASVDLQLTPPTWWRAVGVLQYLFTLIAIVGAGWSVALGTSGLFGLGMENPLSVAGLPLPAFLLIFGLVAGGLLAGVGAWLLTRDARRRRADVQERMDAAVRSVAEERVVVPLRAVLARHRATRLTLAGETPAVAMPSGLSTTAPPDGVGSVAELVADGAEPVASSAAADAEVTEGTTGEPARSLV